MKTEWMRDELAVEMHNHGGYRSGVCALCDAYGWLDKIEHRKDCPLADPKVRALTGIDAKHHIIMRDRGDHVASFSMPNIRDGVLEFLRPAFANLGIELEAKD